MEVYLISLSGIGESQYKLINKDAWDFIHSPAPEKSMEIELPINLRDDYKKQYETDDVHILVSVGTPENDKALCVPAIYIDDESAQFFSVEELTEVIKNKNITILDTYEGCIY